MATTGTPTGLYFELSNDQRMLQELARDFTRKEITPKAEHYDRTGEWPWDIFNKAREVGLVNLNIPEQYGGMGASVLEECIVGDEMAYGCTGIETALMLNQLAALPLLIAGNERQKEHYFRRITEEGKIISYALTEPDAGSDVAGIKTTATKRGDRYILNGGKTWITDAPVASFFIVFAKTNPRVDRYPLWPEARGAAHRHALGEKRRYLGRGVVIARRLLHRARLTLHVHQDDTSAARRDDAEGRRIMGQRRDVVDDARPGGERRTHDGAAASVD